VRGAGVVDATSGREDIWLLKVTGSAFTRFARDEYTTLPERVDRPLFIRMDVRWRYATPAAAEAEEHVEPRAVRDLCAQVFDEFVSESIQHLVHEMGTRVLAVWPQLSEVSFAAENRTRDPVGEDGSRRLYTDPFPAQGLITLRLERGA
jgi:urate oxidase